MHVNWPILGRFIQPSAVSRAAFAISFWCKTCCKNACTFAHHMLTPSMWASDRGLSWCIYTIRISWSPDLKALAFTLKKSLKETNYDFPLHCFWHEESLSQNFFTTTQLRRRISKATSISPCPKIFVRSWDWIYWGSIDERGGKGKTVERYREGGERKVNFLPSERDDWL